MITCETTGARSAPAAGLLILADGTPITFRPVAATDGAALASLFAHLGPESRHARFFSPKDALSARELAYFTDIDHHDHEAIAAVNHRDDSFVGVARYVAVQDRVGVAEVAIEIADAFQRKGIGTAVASLTIQRAQANGLTLLTATTLWENCAARGLLRRHGFRARRSHGTVVEHELRLADLDLATARAQPRPQHDHLAAEPVDDELAE